MMASIFSDHLLSWLIGIPLLGIGVLLCIRDREVANQVALASTLLTFVLSLIMWAGFDFTKADMQFVERFELMPTLKVHYAVGVDGISLLLVLLTTLLFPLAVLCSWTAIISKTVNILMPKQANTEYPW